MVWLNGLPSNYLWIHLTRELSGFQPFKWKAQFTVESLIKLSTFQIYIAPDINLLSNQLDRFSRNAQATNWIEVTKKKLLVKTNFFSTFFLDRNLKMKNLNCYVICTIERRFFPVVKSEINGASDGLLETTKTSLPCSPAVDQSVSWISCANSVTFCILLSRIPRK